MSSLINVDELKENLIKEFGDERPTIAAFAPGRVNLIGEHSDYNDGFVFPMAIEVGTMIVGKAIDGEICFIRTLTEEIQEDKTFELNLNEPIKPVESPKWSNYVIGVLAFFIERTKPNKKRAFRALISTSVPIGGGLSSSASIEVAMCTFLEELYRNQFAADLQLSKIDKALISCRAEQNFAQVPCGVMDQFASSLAEKDHGLFIDCHDNSFRLIPIRDENLCFLITNSNVKHDLTEGKFAENVEHCRDAAKSLAHKTLRDITSIDKLNEGKNRMSDVAFRRAHHVVTEIQRTQTGAKAIEENDLKKFGQLMYESHESLRDYFQVSCDELNQLVDLARSVSGVYGSKMTGAGFGGCTVTLVDKSALEKCIETIRNGYTGEATFYQFHPSAGARLIEMNV